MRVIPNRKLWQGIERLRQMPWTQRKERQGILQIGKSIVCFGQNEGGYRLL